MKKKIGIVGYGGKELFGAGLAYLDFLSQYGEITIILPQQEYVEGFDMLFLPGGPDLNPSSYEEVPGFYTNSSCIYRQFFFDKRLKNYVGNTPIFGVCLGFQMLSCFFGGKLIQNLEDHLLDKNDQHEIYTKDKQLITYKIAKKDVPVMVSSSHHQGITERLLGKDLQILAQSEEGYIEAFKHSHLPISAVQWHPERSYTTLTDNLIKELLNFKK